MNVIDYLLQKASEEEILNTWSSMGEMIATNKTKLYPKNSLYRVNASDNEQGTSPAPLHNSIIFISEEYRVDGKKFMPIDWQDMTVDDVKGIYASVQGIVTPFFIVLPAKWSGGFLPDQNFIPYDEASEVAVDVGGIDIPDEMLEMILTVVGLPFVRFSDLEFSKNQIIKYCIKPALFRYYGFRPIIQEDSYGQISAGQPFDIPFPPFAYYCIPFYTVPGGGSGAGAGGVTSPFSYYNEMLMTGSIAGSSRFGRGVTYFNKAVPGYTGNLGMTQRATQMDNLAASQGYLNLYRREKWSRVNVDGYLYARGYSTIGGNLNMKWLLWSPNFNDVAFEDLDNMVFPMCRSEVLRNFGLIRSLVKSDLAGELDPGALKEIRDDIEGELRPILKSIGITGLYAIERGGG